MFSNEKIAMLMSRNISSLVPRLSSLVPRLFPLFLAGAAAAQDDPVLMRVNGREVLRSEFEYHYRRQQERTTPEAFAIRYADRKLKVAEAEAEGLDTLRSFRQAMGQLRRDLTYPYLTDAAMAEQEARQAYRQLKERRRGEELYFRQIFFYLPQNATTGAVRRAEARMDSIYRVLQQPEADVTLFDTCVRRFSDDRDAHRVSVLQLTSEFEEAVFPLSAGRLSRPFFTPLGLHLVKLLERRELPPFDTLKDELLRRQMQRGKIDRATVARLEQLKRDYRYTPDAAAQAELFEQGTTTRTLFTLEEQPYTGQAFARFAASFPAGVKRQYDAFVAKSLLDREADRVEQANPSLRLLLQARRDSLLLVAITERKMGAGSDDDESLLQSYLDAHREAYYWPEPRYRGIVLHCVTKQVARHARKFLKHLPEAEWMDAIRLTFNAEGRKQIEARQGVYAPGDDAYVDRLVFKRGEVSPFPSYPFTVVLGRKQRGPERVEEVRRQLQDDYRRDREYRWTVALRASGKVEIHQEVLKTVNNH